MKKTIYLDLDGVIFSFSEHFLNYLNFEDKSEPTKWEDSRFKNNMHKVENDISFWLSLPTLVKPNEIPFIPDGYCTARSIYNSITAQSLRNNDFEVKDLITVGLGGSKVKALKDAKCDVFIDDSEHNFKELNDNGILTYLMDRSHNRHIDTPLRVHSLKEFYTKAKLNILIIGHKEHGKSTVAQMICDIKGLKAEDSSMAAARIFIYDALKAKYVYKSFEEFYNDRRIRRSEWYDLISEYNSENESRLAEDILETNDIYIGMRRTLELEVCQSKKMFDLIIGVFDPKKPLESSDSMDIDIFKHSDVILYVDEDKNKTRKKVERLFGLVKN
jgi:hypothetical protein